MTDRRLKIWIDLENSPHVLFFDPVITALRHRGHEVIVTGRRFCNTLALARARGIALRAIGRGYDLGRSLAIKRGLHAARCLQLWRFARSQRFDVAASHCSHTQAAIAPLLGIPTFAALDYEHAYLGHLRRVHCLMTPEVIPAEPFERAGIQRGAIRSYGGLKEDVYLAGWRPATDVRQALGIAEEEILALFRPCSDSAHYGSDAGQDVERPLIGRVLAQREVRVIVLPRTVPQERRWRSFDGNGQLLVSMKPFDGPSLIHASDVLISGGGTMVREAAVLGVPAISCFIGPLGAIDTMLVREGRVQLIRSPEEVDRIGPLARRKRPVPMGNSAPLRQIVDAICAIANGGASL